MCKSPQILISRRNSICYCQRNFCHLGTKSVLYFLLVLSFYYLRLLLIFIFPFYWGSQTFLQNQQSQFSIPIWPWHEELLVYVFIFAHMVVCIRVWHFYQIKLCNPSQVPQFRFSARTLSEILIITTLDSCRDCHNDQPQKENCHDSQLNWIVTLHYGWFNGRRSVTQTFRCNI